MGFAINNLTEVKAAGICLEHRGQVINRFTRNRPQAVQFPDNCIGYHDGWKLREVLPEEAASELHKKFMLGGRK